SSRHTTRPPRSHHGPPPVEVACPGPGPRPIVTFLFFSLRPPPQIYTLSLHDALPIFSSPVPPNALPRPTVSQLCKPSWPETSTRSEEHTSELQSRENLVCRLLLEKKNRHSRAT